MSRFTLRAGANLICLCIPLHNSIYETTDSHDNFRNVFHLIIFMNSIEWCTFYALRVKLNYMHHGLVKKRFFLITKISISLTKP